MSVSTELRGWLFEPLMRRFNRLEDLIMGKFEDVVAELETVTSGWAEALTASEAANTDLREKLAAALANDEDMAQALADAGLPDVEVALAESEKHAAVIQALIDKLNGAGTDPEAPVDTDPLPPVDETPVDEAPADSGELGDEQGQF